MSELHEDDKLARAIEAEDYSSFQTLIKDGAKIEPLHVVLSIARDAIMKLQAPIIYQASQAKMINDYILKHADPEVIKQAHAIIKEEAEKPQPPERLTPADRIRQARAAAAEAPPTSRIIMPGSPNWIR